jgi:hypothetical protein
MDLPIHFYLSCREEKIINRDAVALAMQPMPGKLQIV